VSTLEAQGECTTCHILVVLSFLSRRGSCHTR
jgi:hypothetical protein